MKHSLAVLRLLCTELMLRTALQFRDEYSTFRRENGMLGEGLQSVLQGQDLNTAQ